jgi:subtilisin family serine protease
MNTSVSGKLMSTLFIPEPTPPRSIEPNLFSIADISINSLLGVPKARKAFKVDGAGLAVAVLDTGLLVTHKCFIGRVIESRNFTQDDSGDPNVVTDRNGHGCNVTGIIAAGTKDERRGIAPSANIVPLKVFSGDTPLSRICDALKWVYENAERLKITVANISLAVPGINLTDDVKVAQENTDFVQLLDDLTARRVAVVVAAGNSYYQFQDEGMSMLAIFRQVIAVGAVYDTSFEARDYPDGASASSTHADQLTPFSQRLSKETSPECYTDIFSAGASATSAGAESDDATSVQDGTSQAAPTVAGIILLLQQYYLRMKGVLPPVPIIQDVLRASSTWIVDSDDTSDNVKNTGKKFPRVDAFQSLAALHKAIQLGHV